MVPPITGSGIRGDSVTGTGCKSGLMGRSMKGLGQMTSFTGTVEKLTAMGLYSKVTLNTIVLLVLGSFGTWKALSTKALGKTISKKVLALKLGLTPQHTKANSNAASNMAEVTASSSTAIVILGNMLTIK